MGGGAKPARDRDCFPGSGLGDVSLNSETQTHSGWSEAHSSRQLVVLRGLASAMCPGACAVPTAAATTITDVTTSIVWLTPPDRAKW